MKSRKLFAVALAAVMVFGMVAAAANPALASHKEDDEEFLNGVLEPGGTVQSVVETAASATSSVTKLYTSLTTDNDDTADEHAEAFAVTFNENSDTLVNWSNERIHGSEDKTLFRFQFEDREEEISTVYIDAEWDEEEHEYSSATVISEEEFEERGYDEVDVDGYIEAGWYFSENADEEVEHIAEVYAEEDEELSNGYRVRLASNYAGDIESDLL